MSRLDNLRHLKRKLTMITTLMKQSMLVRR